MQRCYELMFLQELFQFVQLVTVYVMKYTALLSTNLHLVFIVFYLYRYNQNQGAQRVFNLKQ